MTTNKQTSRCAECHERSRDDDALRQHGLRAHFKTRQENEQDRADAVMAEAVDRQQDGAGRRETAGQPGDPAPPDSQRDRERMNPARPDDDIDQQTQQQQRQVNGSPLHAAPAGRQSPMRDPEMESTADDRENASQDGGWAKMTSPDGRLDLGRGRLRVWFEVPGSKDGVRHAQLSSYTPGAIEPRRGDTVAIVPENESEQYITSITEYNAVPSGESVVILNWPNDELPASLRELGGK